MKLYWIGAFILWGLLFPGSMILLYILAPGREWICLFWLFGWALIIEYIEKNL